jgi:hypothetical protein
MAVPDLTEKTTSDLIMIVRRTSSGLHPAAFAELARRSIAEHRHLGELITLISAHRAKPRGVPDGWFAADELYLSRDREAMKSLLSEIQFWSFEEQRDLLSHWAGKGGLDALLSELRVTFGYTLDST